MKRLSYTTLPLLIICSVTHAQIDSNRAQQIVEYKTRTVSLSTEITNEWWLFTNDGSVVICDKQNISLSGEDLVITGSMRREIIPRHQVRQIIMRPGKGGFGEGFIFGLLTAGSLFLSPSNTPGYFVGSNHSSFPGFSVTGVGLTVLAAMGFGSSSLFGGAQQADVISFDGTESFEAWKHVMAGALPRFHLRWRSGFVAARTREAWERHYSSNDLMVESGNTYSPDMTNLNMARSISFSFDLGKYTSLGLAIFTGGESKFTTLYTYSSAVDPTEILTHSLGGESSTYGAYCEFSYDPIQRHQGLNLHLSCALGIGNSRLWDDYSGYSYLNQWTTAVSVTKIGMTALLAAALEYFIDKNFSIGIYTDYAIFGTASIPPEYIYDKIGNTLATIPRVDLNLNSFSVGITTGFHY